MEIYHEKQSLLLCAQHALNNLLQEKAFSKAKLNEICEQLTTTTGFFQLNPHRSVLNLGNYDVNVIEAALISKGYQMSWFDARKDIQTINISDEQGNFLGLIINSKQVPGLQRYFMCSGNHWIAIRSINKAVYNLDSKLQDPQVMSNSQLKEYLKGIQQTNGHIFVVQKQEQNNIEIQDEGNLQENEKQKQMKMNEIDEMDNTHNKNLQSQEGEQMEDNKSSKSKKSKSKKIEMSKIQQENSKKNS